VCIEARQAGCAAYALRVIAITGAVAGPSRGAWGVGDVGIAVAAVGVGVGLAIAFHWRPLACSTKDTLGQQQQQQQHKGTWQQLREGYGRSTWLNRVGLRLAIALNWRPQACSRKGSLKQQKQKGD
jgi:hypothetical protein